MVMFTVTIYFPNKNDLSHLKPRFEGHVSEGHIIT